MLQLPLFVFGTLRRGECNHHYLDGHFDQIEPATLSDFARVLPLMIARESGSTVVGELYRLTPASYCQTLQGCDDLEEIPRGHMIGSEYRRIAVHVETPSAIHIAWAYVSPDADPDDDLLPICDAEAQRLKQFSWT